MPSAPSANWLREIKDNGPGYVLTHVAVDHDPGETDPDNGTLVLESPDDARLARAVACVNFLAGVPNAVLAGKGIDGTLLGLLRAALCNPNDDGIRGALADWIIERAAGRQPPGADGHRPRRQ